MSEARNASLLTVTDCNVNLTKPPIDPRPSRRHFLKASAAVGGGLLLELSFPLANGARADNEFVPNAFIRISREDRVILTMPYVEMGQVGMRAERAHVAMKQA